MIEGKYFNKGREGIVYKCNDGTALKIFFGSYGFGSDDMAKREYQHLCELFSAGVNVPKPIGLEKVILDDSDLKGAGKLRFSMRHGTHKSYELSGIELPAIRKQFIQGVNLYNRFFPSPKIRRAIRELHKNIDRAGFVLQYVKADNYVVTPEEKVYLVDCGCMYKYADVISRKTPPDWMQQRIATCKFEEWLELLKFSLEELKNSRDL